MPPFQKNTNNSLAGSGLHAFNRFVRSNETKLGRLNLACGNSAAVDEK
jgi:hypothetical protein